MRFLHPGALYTFDIPDGWLAAAGAPAFVARQPHYVALKDPLWPVRPVSVLHAQAAPGAALRFDEHRMTALLRAMVNEVPLPALVGIADPASPRVVLREGLHRLHAALALRFRQVPVVLPLEFDL